MKQLLNYKMLIYIGFILLVGCAAGGKPALADEISHIAPTHEEAGMPSGFRELLPGQNHRYHKPDRPDMSRSLVAVDGDGQAVRQLIIKLKPGTSLDLRDFGCTGAVGRENMQKRGLLLAEVPAAVDVNPVLDSLRTHPAVQYAELDLPLQGSVLPVDPYYNEQWYLQQIGMPEAWSYINGSNGIAVAVIDTGVDYNHPDLQGSMMAGKDFVNHDNDPLDDQGHGTMVCGVIAARHNDVGIAGIDPGCRLLPLKAGDSRGSFTTSYVIEAIYTAVDLGARVINMSLGGYSESRALEDALWAAHDAGVVLLAAAGNDGRNSPTYPAAYAPVMAVGSSNQQDQPSSFSNQGNYVDIVAPGENIISTALGGGYKSGRGTSLATPLVSGCAALLAAQNPNWSPEELEWALEAAALPPGPEERWNKSSGYGRLQAARALSLQRPDTSRDVSAFREQAWPVQEGSSYTQLMELPLDEDCYKVELKQAATLSLIMDLVPENLDLCAMVEYCQNGEPVSKWILDDCGLGEGERGSLDLPAGSYYLRIYECYGHWSAQPYRFSFRLQPRQDDDSRPVYWEKEPNNSLELADGIDLNSVGRGVFGTTADVDVFKILFPSEGSVILNFRIPAAIQGIEPDIQLKRVSDNRILYQDEQGEYAVSGQRTSWFQFRGVTAGYYYVILKNKGAGNPDCVYDFSLQYTSTAHELPMPQASVASGDYYAPLKVEITAPAGALIRYTLNGSDPSILNGETYQQPLLLYHSCQLRMVAIKDGLCSQVRTYTYGVAYIKLEAPVISAAGGVFDHQIRISLSAPADTLMRYTLDGSLPTPSHGIIYSAPISLDHSVRLRAVTVKKNALSPVSQEVFIVDPGATLPPGMRDWQVLGTSDQQKSWTIHFSQPLDPQTILASAIRVGKPAGDLLAVQIAGTDDPGALTVRLLDPVPPGTVYFIYLDPGPLSSGGYRLSPPLRIPVFVENIIEGAEG